MTAKFFAILTNQGAAKLANALALGTQLKITEMAVGDGAGQLPVPDPAQTKLINQRRCAPLNMLANDAINTNQIIAEQVIPESEGGWWIREVGLLDEAGDLIAVANCPETYKPQLQEGSGRIQTIRMVLIVSSTQAVALKIDPSVVLATRKYVDDKAIEITGYVDKQLTVHLADENPHKQYLQITNCLSEIKAAGPDAIATVFKNLGLGEAAKLPAITFSRNNTGYMVIPTPGGDAILQWGYAACANEGSASVGLLNYFPVPFPNRCQVMVMSHTGFFPQTAGILSYVVENNSSFRGYSSKATSNSVAGAYFAIGY